MLRVNLNKPELLHPNILHILNLSSSHLIEYTAVCPHQLRVFTACQDIAIFSCILFARALEPW